MAKTKITKTVEFDVATGWKNQTLDLNKYNYDIQFISGKTQVTPPVNIVRTASGNNATLTVETGVQYYAKVKFDKKWVVDGKPLGRKADGSMKHLSINNVDKNGYVKLTLTKIGKNYYFGTDNLYTYGEGTEEEKNIKFGLDNADIVSMSKKETVWYDQEKEYVKMSNFSVYKSVDGGKTYKNVTADYVAAIKDAGDDYTYNASLLTEKASSDIVLKNYGKTGDAWLLNASGEKDIDLLTKTYTIVNTGKKSSYTGSRLNEVIDSSAKNETFNLGTGVDAINFKVEAATKTTPLTGFGHDTVKLNAEETLNLNATLLSGDAASVERSGNNIVISATSGTEKKDVGQLTIQGYTPGKVTLSGFGEDVTAVAINTLVTTAEAATKKGNKFTGTVFADSATSTKANETYALSTGNDEIEFVGNLGKDTVKLTAGEDLTLDFAKAADLNYAIKGNNVVLSSNVKYYATITPTENVEWDTYTYKKGRTYTLELVQVEKSNNEAQLPSGSYTFGMVERNATKAEKAAGYGKISMFLDYTDVNAGYALNSENAPIKYWKVGSDGKTTEVTESEVYGNLALTAESFAAANAKLFNSGSVTLQNYMKLADRGLVSIDGQSGTLADTLETVLKLNDPSTANPYNKSDATKGQTIKGTFLNETFTGSAFNDKITTGNGTDTVTAGKGNDTITLGTGTKTVNIAGGDGNDTIKGLSNATSLELNVSGIDASTKQYTKSGNNLIYEHDYVSGTTKATEKTTIADFFAGSNNSKVSGFTIDTLHISGKGKIAGTDYNDAIVGSAKADKITTGDGADTITAGKGNDTITIDGTGAKTLNFDRTSGKDTVVVSAGDFTSAELVFDGIAVEGNKLTYDHSVDGNDLIVKANYAKVDKTTTTPAQKASTATVTVKDYFADGLAEKVTIGGSPISYGTTLDGTEGKSRAEGKATIGNNIYDMTDSPATTSVAKTVKIFDESGNDLYNVASLKSNTYINDKAGRDALNIKVTDPDNVCMIFDVVADKSKTTDLYKDNSLFIFDKTNIVFDTEDNKGLAAPVGGVEIANFIKVANNGKYSVGSGAIETINVGDETWSGFSSKGLDKLRATVAGWLSKTDYKSAYDVLNNGSKDDIQAMLALYNQNYIPDKAEVTP